MKRFLEANPGFHLMSQSVVKYCLILLLSLSFFGSQYSALFNSGVGVSAKGGLMLSAAGYAKTFHNPFRQLFLSEPASEEEASDDFGPDEHTTIEWCGLFHILSFESTVQFMPERAFFTEFTRSIQNRPTASLFVLHHSWKSFLI